MTNFRVGQKVVCINGAAYSPRTIENWVPRTGGVYTVRGIGFCDKCTLLHLEEYVHYEFLEDGTECGWDASRFRPAVERKTDISIFKAMLNPSKQKETAL